MLLKNLQLNLRNLKKICLTLNVESYLIIHFQKYSRYVPRKIAAIVNEDELFDIEENITAPFLEEKKKSKFQSRRYKADEVQIKNETIFESLDKKEVKSEYSINTKLYENEKLISSIMMEIRSKKHRKKHNFIVLEGKRLIQDALKIGIMPEKIIFSKSQDLSDLPISQTETKLFKLPYRTIQLWSTLATSPGIIGIFRKPKPVEVLSCSLPITIICDNIRDPRNMGSILRSAAGVGCEKVILTKGCVDFWETKVLRSGTGAHFRIPIYDAQDWDDIKLLISNDAHIFIADNNISSCINTEEVQHHQQHTIKKLKNYGTNKYYNAIKKLNDFNVIPYYAVDYTQNEVVLIIGGETEGLSLESIELMETRKGVRVNIPLENGIDSLNAGTALGIIAFEVKRQFLNRWNSNSSI